MNLEESASSFFNKDEYVPSLNDKEESRILYAIGPRRRQYLHITDESEYEDGIPPRRSYEKKDSAWKLEFSKYHWDEPRVVCSASMLVVH